METSEIQKEIKNLADTMGVELPMSVYSLDLASLIDLQASLEMLVAKRRKKLKALLDKSKQKFKH